MQSSHLGRGWGAGKTECIIGDSKIEKRGKPEYGQTSVLALMEGQINCFHRQAAFHINLVLSK